MILLLVPCIIAALLLPVLANSGYYPAIYFANRLPVHENLFLKLLTRVSFHFGFSSLAGVGTNPTPFDPLFIW